jgi:hypothetical protein
VAILYARTEGVLTRRSLDAPGERVFVSSGEGAEAFVANGDKDDGDEREEEGEVGADVPLAKDDTEVLRVPCKEHLHKQQVSISVQGPVSRSSRRTFMLHMSCMPPSP